MINNVLISDNLKKALSDDFVNTLITTFSSVQGEVSISLVRSTSSKRVPLCLDFGPAGTDIASMAEKAKQVGLQNVKWDPRFQSIWAVAPLKFCRTDLNGMEPHIDIETATDTQIRSLVKKVVPVGSDIGSLALRLIAEAWNNATSEPEFRKRFHEIKNMTGSELSALEGNIQGSPSSDLENKVNELSKSGFSDRVLLTGLVKENGVTDIVCPDASTVMFKYANTGFSVKTDSVRHISIDDSILSMNMANFGVVNVGKTLKDLVAVNNAVCSKSAIESVKADIARIVQNKVVSVNFVEDKYGYVTIDYNMDNGGTIYFSMGGRGTDGVRLEAEYTGKDSRGYVESPYDLGTGFKVLPALKKFSKDSLVSSGYTLAAGDTVPASDPKSLSIIETRIKTLGESATLLRTFVTRHLEEIESNHGFTTFFIDTPKEYERFKINIPAICLVVNDKRATKASLKSESIVKVFDKSKTLKRYQDWTKGRVPGIDTDVWYSIYVSAREANANGVSALTEEYFGYIKGDDVYCVIGCNEEDDVKLSSFHALETRYTEYRIDEDGDIWVK